MKLVQGQFKWIQISTSIFILFFFTTLKVFSMSKNETKKLAEWLPSDTQSIVVSRGNFRLTPSLSLKDTFEKSVRMSQKKELWWKYPLMPIKDQFHLYCSVSTSFNEICQKQLYEFVQKRNITFSVKIFRHFSPNQLDLDQKRTPQERACNIVFFDSDPKLQSELVQLLEQHCSNKTNVAGVDIYECNEDVVKRRNKALGSFERFLKAEQDHYLAQGDIAQAKKVEKDYPRKAKFKSVFVAVPQSGILVSAYGDIESLVQVLNAKNDAKGPNKFLQTPEWSLIKENSSIYGLRHFSLAGRNDPSSPLNLPLYEKTLSARPLDPQAVGFVLNMSPKNLEYLYLSNSNNLKPIFSRLFPVSEMNGDLQKDGTVTFYPKKIQIKVDIDTKSANLSPTQARFWLGQIK